MAEGKKVSFILLSLFFFSFFLLLVRSAIYSYWGDEAYTALVVVQPWGDFWKTLLQDVHPPLYWLVLKPWAMVAGTSELALRYPSILFALGSLALFITLVRRMFPGKGVEVSLFGKSFSLPLESLLGFLLALCPAFLLYAPMARYYSISLFLFLLSTLLFLNAVEGMPYPGRGGWGAGARWWGLYAFSLALLIYTDPVAWTGALFHFAYLLIRGERGKGIWLLCFLISFLLFLPYIPTLFTSLRVHKAEATLPLMATAKEWVAKAGFGGWDFLVGQFIPPFVVLIPAWLCALILFLTGYFQVLPPPPALPIPFGRRFFFLLVWALPIYALLMTVAVRIGIEFFPARVLFILPAFVAIAGLGIYHFLTWKHSLRWFIPVLYLMGILWVDALLFLRQDALFSTYVTRWREEAQRAKEQTEGVESIIVADELPLLFYLKGQREVFILNEKEKLPELQDKIIEKLPKRIVVNWNPKDVTGGAMKALFQWLSLAYADFPVQRVYENPQVTYLKHLAGISSPAIKREIYIWSLIPVELGAE